MSALDSNLSDPKYGYDLVIAVTQESINATMKQFLAGVTEPEVTCCYVYDNNNDLVPIDYTTLKLNAKGSDPFNIPNGLDPASNQDLINLTNANFAGAVKAQIGLPDMLPANIPAIVTLGSGAGAPVVFNLFCSEFIIAGFVYGPRGKTTWINQAQPDGQAWYFSSHVSLDKAATDLKSSVPPAVQQRIQQLNSQIGPDAFSIQQLFLDLDTAIVNTTPTIVGIPADWPVWSLIETVFLGAYFAQLKRTGQPVLSYSVSVKNPLPSTLQLGAISHECSPLTNNGQPISNPTQQQLNAATLDYLGTSSSTPPIPVTFSWNWIELGDLNSFSGVLSARRGAFLNFFANLLDRDVQGICMQTVIDFSSTSKGYLIGFNATPSATPSTFQVIASPGAPASDGFTDVMTISFSSPTSNDCDGGDLTSIHGEFNYNLTGAVALHGNQIRIVLTATAYMKFTHKEWGIEYTDLGGANYYDKTYTFLFTMGVGQNGELEVTPTQSVVDSSASFNFQAKGLMGLAGAADDVKNGLTQTESSLADSLDSVFTSYGNFISDEVNGYQGWVFPGASSFVCRGVTFSSGLDLITQLTYVDPS